MDTSSIKVRSYHIEYFTLKLCMQMLSRLAVAPSFQLLALKNLSFFLWEQRVETSVYCDLNTEY